MDKKSREAKLEGIGAGLLGGSFLVKEPGTDRLEVFTNEGVYIGTLDKTGRIVVVAVEPDEDAPRYPVGGRAMAINMNDLAKRITLREGGSVEISVAQVKEVLRITLLELSNFEYSEVRFLINRVRANEDEKGPLSTAAPVKKGG